MRAVRSSDGVAAELLGRIARHGSVRFDEFVDVALYHPDGGFFASGGGAGRAGADFLTSPEVGPLFGAVVARHLDRRWDELGRPDPFVVVESAAGRGALGIAVLAAAPRCAAALRLVLVERSAALRDAQREHLSIVHPFEVLGPEADPERDEVPAGRGAGPLVCSLEDLPAQRIDGVVLANELLDNLPFRLLERSPEGWSEVRVTVADGAPPRTEAVAAVDGDGVDHEHLSGVAHGGDVGGGERFVELLSPTDEATAARADALAPEAQVGARIPIHDTAIDWLAEALAVVGSGSVVVLDYGSSTAALAARPVGEWLRTYRRHGRGGAPLEVPGGQDVTCEVAFDQLLRVAVPESNVSQAEWLRDGGIDELVEEGRRVWAERAAAPDLSAMRARSRISEAEALTDPAGLGAFRVLEWRR